jgi:cell wall-associated NlpC family hydrolase
MAQPIPYSDLLGVPFKDGGRDLAGLDCWGLVMEVSRRQGRSLPDYQVPCYMALRVAEAAADEISAGKFYPVAVPQAGDLVAMALLPEMPDLVQHFGIMIDGQRFLHTLIKTGPILSRVNGLFNIKGFYAYD